MYQLLTLCINRRLNKHIYVALLMHVLVLSMCFVLINDVGLRWTFDNCFTKIILHFSDELCTESGNTHVHPRAN